MKRRLEKLMTRFKRKKFVPGTYYIGRGTIWLKPGVRCKRIGKRAGGTLIRLYEPNGSVSAQGYVVANFEIRDCHTKKELKDALERRGNWKKSKEV